MARSVRKGPYVDKKVLKKVKAVKESGSREPIKTWARSSQISPEMVGVNLSIHNGKKFISVFVTEPMVGHRLGEFAPTRTFKGHGHVAKRILSPT